MKNCLIGYTGFVGSNLNSQAQFENLYNSKNIDTIENQEFDFNGPIVVYPLSLEKITRMYKGAVDNGFTSFAEA